ncbi:MAG: hypothetical protein WD448_12480 [Woeseia sp.]
MQKLYRYLPHRIRLRSGAARRRTIALYLILPIIAAGCAGDAPQETKTAADCIEGGELSATIVGSIESELRWLEDALECDGMPRPHGQGARLHFAGPATSRGENLRLAFIIALPDLMEGDSANELPAGVTLIDETAARFFSTPDAPSCWADIEQQQQLEDLPDAQYRIEGLLYCVSPLAEVNGGASVTFTDLRFAGRLSWQKPE